MTQTQVFICIATAFLVGPGLGAWMGWRKEQDPWDVGWGILGGLTVVFGVALVGIIIWRLAGELAP